jgi:ERCC4-type nuclease
MIHFFLLYFLHQINIIKKEYYKKILIVDFDNNNINIINEEEELNNIINDSISLYNIIKIV